MPIPVFDPSRFPLQRANMPTPDYSGMVNFIPQALQSYQGTLKAAETPYELRHQRMMNMEKLKEQAFKNALAEEFGRKEKEAEIASKLAYAQYYQQGGGAYAPTGLGKAFMERDRLIAQHGEDSDQVKNYDNYIKKISGEFAQIPGAARTKQINSSLARKSRQFLQDKVEIPKDYIGGGGEYRLHKDVNEYNRTKDPVRKQELFEKLTQSALARKLVPDYAIDIITSQGNTATVSAQEEQKKSITQGWPATMRAEIPNLPKEILEEANIRHNKTIDELGTLRENNFEQLKQGNNDTVSEKEYDEMVDIGIKNVVKQYGVDEETAKDLIDTAKKYNSTVEDVYEDLVRAKKITRKKHHG